MLEEKILESEIMSDDELEGVAGGLYETWQDRVNFINLGGKRFYKGDFKDGSYAATDVEDAFKRMSIGDPPNAYYLDGKEISRDEMWSIINEACNAIKKFESKA